MIKCESCCKRDAAVVSCPEYWGNGGYATLCSKCYRELTYEVIQSIDFVDINTPKGKQHLVTFLTCWLTDELPGDYITLKEVTEYFSDV